MYPLLHSQWHLVYLVLWLMVMFNLELTHKLIKLPNNAQQISPSNLLHPMPKVNNSLSLLHPLGKKLLALIPVLPHFFQRWVNFVLLPMIFVLLLKALLKISAISNQTTLMLDKALHETTPPLDQLHKNSLTH